jgi:hypothetical protein
MSRIEGTLLAARLPPVNISTAEEVRTFDLTPSFHSDLDLSTLVSIRHAHETKRAKKSVRTHARDGCAHEGDTKAQEAKEPSLCHKILREMNRVLCEEQDQRKTTGVNRAATWKSSAPGGRALDDSAALTGNSANAELAAGQRSLTVSWALVLLTCLC